MGILSDIVQTIGIGLGWYQQQKQFDYDQALQQQMFEREDTAVQRRAADLQAAGLSPTLAAGSAAQTMAPIRAQVPGAGIGNQIAEAQALRTSLMRQEADITKTVADAKRATQEAHNAVVQYDILNETRRKLEMENEPLRRLYQNSDDMFWSIDPQTKKIVPGKEGLSVSDALAAMAWDKFAFDWKIGKNNVSISDSNDIYALHQASLAGSQAAMAAWDNDITKSLGVRTSDKIDGFLTSLGSQLGLIKEGTPWGSAANQVIGKIINTITGLLKQSGYQNQGVIK